MHINIEQERLKINELKEVPLEKWGPYLSERQWGTVREDYSPNGDAWHYFPFEHSHCRQYKWGEDGLAGISDYNQNFCFAWALWNGQDSILKERLFGLGNGEGNHGEDVKELYYYLDNIPSHYYMDFLYKYPQQAFPYDLLKRENRQRSKKDREFEILDTGIFDHQQYFDVQISYAKFEAEDIVAKIAVTNRYQKQAPIHILPTFWLYQRHSNARLSTPPIIKKLTDTSVLATHERAGQYYLYFQAADHLLFTNNETNKAIVTGEENASIFTKDAFHNAIIQGENLDVLQAQTEGSKCAPVYKREIDAGETLVLYVRISATPIADPLPASIESIFQKRKEEADLFYEHIFPPQTNLQQQQLLRQAYAGLLWSKQFYHFDIERWLSTNDGITPISAGRATGRNNDWKHLKNQDIISMPDKWEYPWYAAWDLAFQCIPLAAIDPCFAKNQLLLIMREWYMKPDGQLPAYEWNFGDVNPPVHAWATFQVYQIEKKKKGKGDIRFLKRAFQKLIINFTWWINRKDKNGNNIFEGGFLGLDNIGVFNRSHHFAGEMQLEQADGTSWMGTYALSMMDIALEIARYDDAYEDTATKFFEHFVLIAEALNEHHLWNEEDKFFYDVLCSQGADPIPLRIQSIVGLTPLYAAGAYKKLKEDELPDLRKRIGWFERYRKRNKLYWPAELNERGDVLLSLVARDRLVYLLKRLLDENEFLSPGGIRALSKYHEENPYSVKVDGHLYSIRYDPGDSTSDMFGGNSNWRGPVWMPINFIIIQSLRQYGDFYGNDLLVECPTGSGIMKNLHGVADEISARILSMFERDVSGNRRIYDEANWFYRLPENKDLILFYEYFHGDSGRGLGASHQTGWTALVASLWTK